MSLPHYEVNSSFDPWTQDFYLTQPDGHTPVIANLATVAEVQRAAVSRAICQGAQVGAALILLITLILVTKSDKRRSMVFLLNSLALLFVVLRGVLSLLVYTGPFYNFYRWQLMWYADTNSARTISSGAEIMAFFLTMMIELSLVFQVRIVCCNLSDLRRFAINYFIGFVAFVATVMRFALMVLSIDWNIAHIEDQTPEQFQTLTELASATNITLVISIALSALFFCAKLWFAIQARQSMGMTQFGPMQIIFVMGCQTMFTPLIFTIVSYWGVKDAQMGSFVPTIVAISLPLSAMWASVNTNNIQIAKPDARGHRAIPVGLADSKEYDSKEHFGSTNNTSETLIDDDSAALHSPKKTPRFSDAGVDLEMQKVGKGVVQIDRTYSVRSD